MLKKLVWICLSALLLPVASLAQQSATKPQQGYQVVGMGVTGASQLQPNAGRGSRLEFESSDARLVQAFDWAKRQAMAFVVEGDPVGPWYDAAEPGRESFCMRDTAHQVMGAHALGLAKHNQNMLRRFAENISESKDWCSYWEINSQNQPHRVDYKDDSKFWYNLPANFDVLDAAYRMFLWTGDQSYVNDPVFLNFYDKTVGNYVERWGLDLDHIMTRPRILNARGIFDPKDKFQKNRGIPGYDEQTRGYTVAADVLAAQYSAYSAYSYIQEWRGNAALGQLYDAKAQEVKALVNNKWWSEKDQSFYGRVNANQELEGRGTGVLLFHDVIDDGPKLAAAVKDGGRGDAETLYKYGKDDEAHAQMLEVAFGPRSRREYPETSFTWVGALVNGTMGITIVAPRPAQAWVAGFWTDALVRTLPGLGTKVAWAEIRNLPIRANEVTVRHEGIRKTMVINQKGPAFMWQATFAGAHESLLVNGQPAKATVEKGRLGQVTSSVRVTVGAGGAARVEVPGA